MNPRRIVLETIALPTELYPYEFIPIIMEKAAFVNSGEITSNSGERIDKRPYRKLLFKSKQLASVIAYQL